jgi:hypothetical protein
MIVTFAFAIEPTELAMTGKTIVVIVIVIVIDLEVLLFIL